MHWCAWITEAKRAMNRSNRKDEHSIYQPHLIRVLCVALLVLLLPATAAAYNKSWDQGHNVCVSEDGKTNWGKFDDSGVFHGGYTSKDCCEKYCKVCPVYANTGQLQQSFTDLSVAGVGPALLIKRTYNSQDWASSFLGQGWTFNFGKRLIIARNSDDEKIIGLLLETGEKNYYREHDDGTLERLTGYGADFELVKNADGRYSIRELGGGRTELDATGKIQQIIDRNGNALSFQYNAVGCVSRITNASGNHIDFTLGPNGKIASATDNFGRSIGYTYDERGNLIAVTDPLGNSVQYGYNSDNLLTQRTNARGDVIETIAYDSHQPPRVASFVEKGETFTVQYFPDRTEKSDSQGNTWTYYYNDVGVITRTVDPLGNETEQQLNKLTATSVDWEEDANGNRTSYTYDALGNVASSTDALGNTWTYTYVAGTDWLETETNPAGRWRTPPPTPTTGRATRPASPTPWATPPRTSTTAEAT
jgi:YD repeat-containing protein